ncbi:AAA-domain-containing protein, partial [Fragilariopsis cylindrus CCMP1102]
VLPHVSLDGLWESLIFDSNVKKQLLAYAQSAIQFCDKKVSSHIVQWNRILLLHGVPGCGKTSCCRALAQKLAIRLKDRFPRSILLDIHSHSLFSKWFSTSGKLISSLFSMVRDMVEDDPKCLVCILIDEVESLASSRGQQQSGDPSDAMRAVNSLLTSLDRLRSFPNVMVLATTNLTGRIDAAFVDRVDLKVHIGLPILRARYEIMRTCLKELIRVGIVVEEREKIVDDESGMLLSCSREADGLSGRSLRRLPLQAYA